MLRIKKVIKKIIWAQSCMTEQPDNGVKHADTEVVNMIVSTPIKMYV